MYAAVQYKHLMDKTVDLIVDKTVDFIVDEM